MIFYILNDITVPCSFKSETMLMLKLLNVNIFYKLHVNISHVIYTLTC